ncbi:MAG TPA: rRNA adenine N-6-methyltransferase family protein [Caulobacteraceae bacterium]|jgi:protein-L-isoaspartate(D-aspartate) O-methyltransferase|nr:rRNA adenine N-6-methyltransferase family protein [Caulobacteraceae bacterium]
MDESELQIVRRAYAKQVTAFAGVANPSVEAAFAAVRREDYLGPGPWPIVRFEGYAPTPSDDPVYLYSDMLFGIVPERGLNNGQPSLHAALLASAAPKAGDHVVHVGSGVGYFTAIMAHMVSPSGRVTAIEFDPALAERCRANFADAANVRVIQGDGSSAAFAPADVIYVNAGATRPADAWLDRLKDGGRLILPLTTNQNFSPEALRPGPVTLHGGVLRVERQGDDFAARFISRVAIFPCEGARDAASEAELAKAFAAGGWQKVTRLYRGDDARADGCWLRAPGWALA